MDVRRATEELRAKGIRLTRQRAAVLAALGQAERGLNPEEILARAQSECPELGLTTVYRAIGASGFAGDSAAHSHWRRLRDRCGHESGARP